MSERVAIILDGGFVKVKLESCLGRFPTPEDIVQLTHGILGHERLRGSRLLRVYYYDAPPLSGTKLNPLNGTPYHFGSHPVHARNQSLQDGLDIAWLAIKRIVHTIVLVTGDSDFVPAMKFARREGLRVYLDTMGHGVRPGLVEHADCVFDSRELCSIGGAATS